MSKLQEKSRAWINWAAVLLLAYPISVGPAAWICSVTDRDWMWSAYANIYRPLIWAVTRSRITDSVYSWYVGLVGATGESG